MLRRAPADGWISIVLAAGRGTRMGGPKALMDLAGRPWWQHQEDRLERAGVARLWVVSDAVADSMRAAAADRPLPRLVIADAEAPMFASILAGVRAFQHGAGVFVLPVDVPAPRASVFNALAMASHHRVAVPALRGQHGHPVALGAAWIARRLERARAADRLDALISPEAVEVEVEDPAVLVNLNTPGDLAAWATMARPSGA